MWRNLWTSLLLLLRTTISYDQFVKIYFRSSWNFPDLRKSLWPVYTYQFPSHFSSSLRLFFPLREKWVLSLLLYLRAPLVCCLLPKLVLILETWLHLDTVISFGIIHVHLSTLCIYLSCLPYSFSYHVLIVVLTNMSRSTLPLHSSGIAFGLFCLTHISAEWSCLSSPVVGSHFLSHYCICCCHSSFQWGFTESLKHFQ